MNLYLRYFDKETLVSTVEDAIDFLASIPEISMDPDLEADIRDYCNSDVYYPKRYKVRPRVYFIIIKTEAATMLDFKEKKALRPSDNNRKEAVAPAVARLTEEREGWYEGMLDRIVDHLRSRVDGRSQFPSAKGKNFKFRYLGMWK